MQVSEVAETQNCRRHCGQVPTDKSSLFKVTIRCNQEELWKELCCQVNQDLPYEIVVKKMYSQAQHSRSQNCRTTGINRKYAFPTICTPMLAYFPESFIGFDLFTGVQIAEVGSRLSNSKAPGSDRVSDIVLKENVRVRPGPLLNTI